MSSSLTNRSRGGTPPSQSPAHIPAQQTAATATFSQPASSQAADNKPHSSDAHAPISDSFLEAMAQNARKVSTFEGRSRAGNGTATTSPLAVSAESFSDQVSPISSTSQTPSTPLPPSAFRVSERRLSQSPRLGENPRPRRRGCANPESDENFVSMNRRISSEKGKSRDVNGMWGIPEGRSVKQAQATWVLDPTEMQVGKEGWGNTTRIVLCLGAVTLDALKPLLYNPTFANTVVLVGTCKPVAAIDNLLSPSHLLSASPDQEIYPTVQPFQPTSAASENDPHAITNLLEQACKLAKQHRTRPALSTRSRQPSSSSLPANASPPSSPRMRNRVLSGLGISSPSRTSLDVSDKERRNSGIAASHSSRIDMSNSHSGSSLRDFGETSNRNSRPGLSPSSTRTSFLGLFKSDSEEKGVVSSHLLDAVVNFVPSVTEMECARMVSKAHAAATAAGKMDQVRTASPMSEMIQQAFIVSSGVLPALTRTVGKARDDDPMPLPVTLLHVIPPKTPAVVAPMMESYLLNFISTYQDRCTRELFGCIVTESVWSRPLVTASNAFLEERFSGAEVLLVGGVRCPYQTGGRSGRATKPRAQLNNWDSCIAIPGVIADARRPLTTRTSLSSRSLAKQANRNDPPSVAYHDVAERTPPIMGAERLESPAPCAVQPTLTPLNTAPATRPLHTSTATSSSLSPPPAQPQRRSKLSAVATAGDLPVSPPTPELVPSASSCSSSFAMGETNSQNSQLSGTGPGGGPAVQEPASHRETSTSTSVNGGSNEGSLTVAREKDAGSGIKQKGSGLRLGEWFKRKTKF